jgi:hypothetical protein
VAGCQRHLIRYPPGVGDLGAHNHVQGRVPARQCPGHGGAAADCGEGGVRGGQQQPVQRAAVGCDPGERLGDHPALGGGVDALRVEHLGEVGVGGSGGGPLRPHQHDEQLGDE